MRGERSVLFCIVCFIGGLVIKPSTKKRAPDDGHSSTRNMFSL